VTTTTVTTYTYDVANRLTSIQQPASSIAYAWDARGNLTHDGVFTYTYNAAGRMVRAQSLTATLRYTYTVDGLRVAQDVDGAVTTFAWDWATGIPEMLSDGDKRHLVGHDTLGWEDGAGSWTYAVPDALGSVRQAVDATAAVVAAREWTPYGVEVGAPGGTPQAGLGYTGEWFDASVGLQYLRARWYDSYLNHFTSSDTIVPRYHNPQSINGYIYVLGNPIRFTDPSGLVPEYNQIGDITAPGVIPSLLEGQYLDFGYQYSCNCGWIDWGHAISGMLRKTSLAHRILSRLTSEVDWGKISEMDRGERYPCDKL
jgi:RHS repeat-associated protein